ncbi:hypothetical protein [Oceanobacillus kapialis]|uniref:Uncharacterized protein n=1 Tax=Oceanobacillus kapialis TaxID=481353 RepID=A0ABW5Q176_9BACI
MVRWLIRRVAWLIALFSWLIDMLAWLIAPLPWLIATPTRLIATLPWLIKTPTQSIALLSWLIEPPAQSSTHPNSNLTSSPSPIKKASTKGRDFFFISPNRAAFHGRICLLRWQFAPNGHRLVQPPLNLHQ